MLAGQNETKNKQRASANYCRREVRRRQYDARALGAKLPSGGGGGQKTSCHLPAPTSYLFYPGFHTLSKAHISESLCTTHPHAHISPGIGSWFWAGEQHPLPAPPSWFLVFKRLVPGHDPPHGSWLYYKKIVARYAAAHLYSILQYSIHLFTMFSLFASLPSPLASTCSQRVCRCRCCLESVPHNERRTQLMSRPSNTVIVCSFSAMTSTTHSSSRGSRILIYVCGARFFTLPRGETYKTRCGQSTDTIFFLANQTFFVKTCYFVRNV